MSDNPGNSDLLTIDSCHAAMAAIAQSVANVAQDNVDAMRNRSIINYTVMGSAYVKWLENPVMKDQYEPIIEKAQQSIKAEFQMAEKVFETHVCDHGKS